MTLALPGARGLFSLLQETLRHATPDSRVALTSHIHDILDDFRELYCSLSHCLTCIQELVPLTLTVWPVASSFLPRPPYLGLRTFAFPLLHGSIANIMPHLLSGAFLSHKMWYANLLHSTIQMVPSQTRIWNSWAASYKSKPLCKTLIYGNAPNFTIPTILGPCFGNVKAPLLPLRLLPQFYAFKPCTNDTTDPSIFLTTSQGPSIVPLMMHLDCNICLTHNFLPILTHIILRSNLGTFGHQHRSSVHH